MLYSQRVNRQYHGPGKVIGLHVNVGDIISVENYPILPNITHMMSLGLEVEKRGDMNN